jgi:hypothetical protein
MKLKKTNQKLLMVGSKAPTPIKGTVYLDKNLVFDATLIFGLFRVQKAMILFSCVLTDIL